MTCPPIESLSDLLDNALTFKERRQIKQHLKNCSHCTHRLTAEARLSDMARGIGEHAPAPETLRRRLQAAVPPYPAPHRRSTLPLTAAACLALVLLAAFLLRPFAVPPPAFAQVINAMQQIHTAQWTEELLTYDVSKGKSRRFVVTHCARLDPPALSTIYSKRYQQALTPDLITVVQGKGYRVFTAPSTALGFSSVEQNPSATPSSVLREHILNQIMAPRSPGGGTAAWRSSKERIEGQERLRFDSQIMSRLRPKSNKTINPAAKLTTPGYRYRLWADPVTLRIVRAETDYYDGQKYSRTIRTQYVYDQPLPLDAFRNKDR